LNCIAAAYKKQFRQDSVLISQVQTNAIFNWWPFVIGHPTTNATQGRFHSHPVLRRWTC
jgi:hypothetical protein